MNNNNTNTDNNTNTNTNNNNMSSVDFTLIGLKIQDSISQLPIEDQQEIYNYLIQMNEMSKKAYLIALNHLGTSFNIYKSNGFKEWKNNK